MIDKVRVSRCLAGGLLWLVILPIPRALPIVALALAAPSSRLAVGGAPSEGLIAGAVDAGPPALPASPPRPMARPGNEGDGDADPFVRVSGDQLVWHGRPFRFVGANLAIMHGPESRAAAEQVLEGAARDGIRVGRIWAFGEGAADAAPALRQSFLFRAGPNGWIDDATAHLDRVLVAARRAGLRLIITLSNNWSDYGGVPRYLRWSGGWRDGAYGATDRFYTDRRARAAFRAHVERLLQRTNALTGVAYRDDPTILAWELMNESTTATAAGADARRAWMVEMARLIHARDPHHLVTPGISGYRFERERQDWLRICRLPEMDFCDGHLYPEELLRNRDVGALDDALDDSVRLARTLAGKPFVLGEFGVRGDPAGTPDQAATRLWRGQTRAAWIAHILQRLRYDAASGGLIWIYQGRGGADRSHGVSVDAPGIDAGADAVRSEIRRAAQALKEDDARAGAPAAVNPRVSAPASEVPLLPLHQVFEGQARAAPVLGADLDRGDAISVAWDPLTYARADWESTGIYTAGAVEHAWGGETGWFEYEYRVVAPAQPAQHGRRPGAPAEVAVRARLSSEYPGSTSPPDGASRFQVWLDGARLGTALAPRDDGRGAWVAIHARARPELANVLAPGTHRLRFEVDAGPHAHGLAIYGRAGENAAATAADTGPVQLRFGF